MSNTDSGGRSFTTLLYFHCFSMKNIFKILLNAPNRKKLCFYHWKVKWSSLNGTNRPGIHLLWHSEISSVKNKLCYAKELSQRRLCLIFFCPSKKRLKDHCAHCSVAAISSFSISLHAPSSSPLYRRGRGKQFAGSTVDRRRKSGWFPNISSLIKAAAP